MKKEKKVKELVIDENSLGITAIALVDKPAIEEDFMKFNQDEKVKFELDKEKRIITGPALIPDKMIYRYDKKTDEEYYVFFSESTIESLAIKFFKDFNIAQVNLDHDENKMLDNVYVFESWVIEDSTKDKATALGFDLPKGTWMISMKVDSEEVWDELSKEEVKGFSIEGYFVENFCKQEKTNAEKIVDEIKNILSTVGL